MSGAGVRASSRSGCRPLSGLAISTRAPCPRVRGFDMPSGCPGASGEDFGAWVSIALTRARTVGRVRWILTGPALGRQPLSGLAISTRALCPRVRVFDAWMSIALTRAGCWLSGCWDSGRSSRSGCWLPRGLTVSTRPGLRVRGFDTRRGVRRRRVKVSTAGCRCSHPSGDGGLSGAGVRTPHPFWVLRARRIMPRRRQGPDAARARRRQADAATLRHRQPAQDPGTQMPPAPSRGRAAYREAG